MTRRVVRWIYVFLVVVLFLSGSIVFQLGLAVVAAKKPFYPGAFGWFGLWLFNAMFATWTRWAISAALAVALVIAYNIQRRLERRPR